MGPNMAAGNGAAHEAGKKGSEQEKWTGHEAFNEYLHRHTHHQSLVQS